MRHTSVAMHLPVVSVYVLFPFRRLTGVARQRFDLIEQLIGRKVVLPAYGISLNGDGPILFDLPFDPICHYHFPFRNTPLMPPDPAATSICQLFFCAALRKTSLL